MVVGGFEIHAKRGKHMPVRCLGCMMEVADESVRHCPFCNSPIPLPRDDIQHLTPGTGLQQGRYIIGRCLGRGGFGITYLAWDSVMRGPRAVKEYFPAKFASRIPPSPEVHLNSAKATDAYRRGLRSFHNEAIHLEELRDVPGIVRIYSYFEENNTGYLVMEFLTGMTLSKFIQLNRSRLSLEEANQMILKILYVVKGLHDKKIVIDGKSSTLLHRDISTDNIFISQSGQVTLLDFGSAREEMQQEHSELTNSTKAGYSAPEQINNWRQGTYTDVYAVGVCYFKLLTGHLPSMNTDGQLQSIRDEMKNVPAWVDQVFHKATQFKVENRYKTADEFIRDLQSHSSGKPRHRIGIIVLGGLIGVLAVGIAGVLVVALLPDGKDDGPAVNTTVVIEETTVAAATETPTALPTEVPATETPTVAPTTAPPTDAPEATEVATEIVITEPPTEKPTDEPTPVPTDVPTPVPTATPVLMGINEEKVVTYVGDSTVIMPQYADGASDTKLTFTYNSKVIAVNQLEDGSVEITGLAVGSTSLIFEDELGNVDKVDEVSVQPMVIGVDRGDVRLPFGQTETVTILTQENKPAPQMTLKQDVAGVRWEQQGNELRITADDDANGTLVLEGGGGSIEITVHTPGVLRNAQLNICPEDALGDSSQWSAQRYYTVGGAGSNSLQLIPQDRVAGQYVFFVIDNTSGLMEDVQYEGLSEFSGEQAQMLGDMLALRLDTSDPQLYEPEGKEIRISDGKREIVARVAIGETVGNISRFQDMENGLYACGESETVPLGVWEGDVELTADSSNPEVVEAEVVNGELHLTYKNPGESVVTLHSASTQESWSVTLHVAPVLRGMSIDKTELYIGDAAQVTFDIQGNVGDGEGFWEEMSEGAVIRADDRSESGFRIEAKEPGEWWYTLHDPLGNEQTVRCTVMPVISNLSDTQVTLRYNTETAVDIIHAEGRTVPRLEVSQPGGVAVRQDGDRLYIRASICTEGTITLSAEGKTYTIDVNCADELLKLQGTVQVSDDNRAEVLNRGLVTYEVETWSGSIHEVDVDSPWRVVERADGKLTLEPDRNALGSMAELGDQEIVFRLGDQVVTDRIQVANGVAELPVRQISMDSGRQRQLQFATLYGTMEGIEVRSANDSIFTVSMNEVGNPVITGAQHGESDLIISDAYGELRIPITIRACLAGITYNGNDYAPDNPPAVEGINEESFILQVAVNGGDLADLEINPDGLNYRMEGNRLIIEPSAIGNHTLQIGGVPIQVNLSEKWRLAKGKNDDQETVEKVRAALPAWNIPIFPFGGWGDDIGEALVQWRKDNNLPGAQIPASEQSLTEDELEMLLDRAQQAQTPEPQKNTQAQTASRPAGEEITVRQMAMGDGMLFVLDDQGYLMRVDPSNGQILYACLGKSNAKFDSMYGSGNFLLLRDENSVWYQIGSGNVLNDEDDGVYKDAPWLRIVYNMPYSFDLVAASETTIAARLSASEDNLKAGSLVYWDETRSPEDYAAGFGPLHTMKLSAENQNTNVTAAAVDGELLVYATENGQLLCLGPDNGLLARLGFTGNARSKAQKINVKVGNRTINPVVKAMDMNSQNLVLVLNDGTALVGGDNSAGQLGEVENANAVFATVTMGGNTLNGIVDARVSGNAVYLLTSDGTLYVQTGGQVSWMSGGVTQLDGDGSHVYVVVENVALGSVQGRNITPVTDRMLFPEQ